MITRLAPTPSGYLHAGNIYNFLLNWLWARSNNGKVLLRIDDADTQRKRPEYVEDIFKVLDWLGLDWDIGPTGPDDFEKNWSQAKRTDRYQELLDQLVAKEMVFACTCSRKELDDAGGRCNCLGKNIPLSIPQVSWRIKIAAHAPVQLSDRVAGTVSIDLTRNAAATIIKRKDGIMGYQLSSLADDRYFAVTHIGRGKDLLPSTAMQLYIDSQLPVPSFTHCQFWHHDLIHTTAGEKLSKSAGVLGSSIIQTLKSEALISSFARWMGWEDARDIQLHELIGRKEFTR